MKRIAEVSRVMAEAVKLCEPKVIAMYPITPQTHIVEALAEHVNNGELDTEIIRTESEHSAISALLGASATGVRTFTATASQGLALMHEVLPVVSGLRLPIVMGIGNRALSAPINIWGDHSDVMSVRDSCWIQLFVKDAQELFDTTIQSFAIAEKTALPVMINIDGFTLTHAFEPVDLLTKNQVKRYLPSFKIKHKLDPEDPKTFGPVGYPNTYWKFKKQQADAMTKAKKIIQQENSKFKKMFKRFHSDGLVETVNPRAKKMIVLLGSIAGTVEEYIRKHKNVGLIRIKCYRPFPRKKLVNLCRKKEIIVFDRAYDYGSKGPLYLDIASLPLNLKIRSVIAGLGGRDITLEMIDKAVKSKQEEIWL